MHLIWSCSTKHSGSRIDNSTTSEIVRSHSPDTLVGTDGTPVENSPDDLVGIFEFLSPGYLKTGMPLPQMAKQAGDYILRRTKDMVLDDMPPKLYRDADLELTPEQWSTYESAETEGVLHLENLEQSLTIQHVFELVLRSEADLQFRSGHRQQLQTGASGGRHGRSRRERKKGDRVQPVGQAASTRFATALATVSARWSTTARFRTRSGMR